MKKILIVEAKYYEEILNELSQGAVEAIENAGFEAEHLYVPGAFEIPAAINFVAQQSGGYAGFVALGFVIRGETTHYDEVCGESARGLMSLTLEKSLCIGYGIVTAENRKQAMVRAARDKKNKGAEAAKACIDMIGIKLKYNS